jgi:VanZ family protein
MLNRLLLSLVRVALVIALLVSTYMATAQAGTAVGASVNDKLAHLMTFFGLALLTDFAFPRWRFGWTKILPLLAYGLLIEIIQLFLPYRTFSLLDLTADAAGIVLYGITLLLMDCSPIVMWRRAMIRD